LTTRSIRSHLLIVTVCLDIGKFAPQVEARLWSKNPYGTNDTLCQIVDRIGQSVYHSTVSAPVTGLRCRAWLGKPSPPLLWFGQAPPEWSSFRS